MGQDGHVGLRRSFTVRFLIISFWLSMHRDTDFHSFSFAAGGTKAIEGPRGLMLAE